MSQVCGQRGSASAQGVDTAGQICQLKRVSEAGLSDAWASRGRKGEDAHVLFGGERSQAVLVAVGVGFAGAAVIARRAGLSDAEDGIVGAFIHSVGVYG